METVGSFKVKDLDVDFSVLGKVSDVEIDCDDHGKVKGVRIGEYDFVCGICYVENVTKAVDSGEIMITGYKSGIIPSEDIEVSYVSIGCRVRGEMKNGVIVDDASFGVKKTICCDLAGGRDYTVVTERDEEGNVRILSENEVKL